MLSRKVNYEWVPVRLLGFVDDFYSPFCARQYEILQQPNVPTCQSTRYSWQDESLKGYDLSSVFQETQYCAILCEDIVETRF